MQRAQRQLLAACDQIVQRVPLPVPFNINRYVRALEQSRNRPIALKYFEHVSSFDQSHPYGCWLNCETEDRIYLRLDASPLHRVFVFLHEAGHIQYGHDRVAAPLDDAFVDAMIADPKLAEGKLRMFSRQEDQQAELFATRVMQHAVITPAWRAEGRSRELVASLSESLAHPVRRERSRG
jgi:hypothetical protein